MHITTLVVRAAMIGFWIGIIIFFLSLPFFSGFLSTEKSINVMMWTELIDPQVIEDFEEQTGIKVHVSYFESNEELYARVKATGGAGYDMLVPSDYAMPWLLTDNLLKPLDRSKITIWDRLDPKLLDHSFDPKNTYSIPYLWQLYGLAIDTNVLPKPEATWGLLFDANKVPGCVVMPDVAREVVLISALYLFGTTEHLDEQKLQKIYQLLLCQKPRVAAYSEMRADFLLTSGVCSVIVSQSTLMWHVTRVHEHITFLVPKEGTFVVLDNFVIPKTSCKDEYVYQFMNFVLQPSVVKYHFERYRYFPATIDLMPLLNATPGGQSVKDAHARVTRNLQFFTNPVPEKEIQKIWLGLKGL